MSRIKQSIDDLPRADRPAGNTPSTNNFLVQRIAEAWEKKNAEEYDRDLARAIPEAGPYRASYAGVRCNRAMYYKMKGIEVSNPLSLADYWRFALGHTVHEMLQEIAADLFPGAEVEVVVDLNAAGIPGSAHADLVIQHEGKKIVVEIKSTGGFKFKMAATSFKGPAEGPSSGHVIQAGLTAEALGADGVIIAYLSLENVSANLAKAYSTGDEGRFAAEWHYSTQELKPLLDTERTRVKNVLSAVNNPESRVPPRHIIEPDIPAGAEITEPDSGLWVKVVPGERAIEATGTTWHCGYCNFRDKCISDGA